MQEAARSIARLGQAFAAAVDNELKEKVASTLLESHLDLGDWRKAEAIFQTAAQRLTHDENTEWYGRIAVLAARANEKQDAMRLWRRVAGVDMTEMRHLQPLARAGLRDELVAYYQELQQALPASYIPPKAIAELRNR
jgi:tetratricopeptide (TPR) repeat protein